MKSFFCGLIALLVFAVFFMFLAFTPKRERWYMDDDEEES